MIKTYKCKDITVEAIKFDERKINEAKKFCGDDLVYDGFWEYYKVRDNSILSQFLEDEFMFTGTVVVDGDYIVKIDNRFHVVDKELFNAIFK